MTPAPYPLWRALLAAFVFWCGGCHDCSGVLTQVLAARGDVTQMDAPGHRLSPGAEILPPFAIRTAADSAVVFSPLPGIMIRLEAGGEMGIEQVALRKRGEEIQSRMARMDLRTGRARIWVDEFRHGTTDVRVRTMAGEAIFRGPALAELAVEAAGGTPPGLPSR